MLAGNRCCRREKFVLLADQTMEERTCSVISSITDGNCLREGQWNTANYHAATIGRVLESSPGFSESERTVGRCEAFIQPMSLGT